MAWKIAFDERTSIVETTYSGLSGGDELREAALAALVAGSARHTHLYLGDYLSLEQAGTLFNIDDLIGLYESLPMDINLKEAILLPLSQKACANLKLPASGARNRGYHLRVFNSRAHALRWLLKN